MTTRNLKLALALAAGTLGLSAAPAYATPDTDPGTPTCERGCPSNNNNGGPTATSDATAVGQGYGTATSTSDNTNTNNNTNNIGVNNSTNVGVANTNDVTTNVGVNAAGGDGGNASSYSQGGQGGNATGGNANATGGNSVAHGGTALAGSNSDATSQSISGDSTSSAVSGDSTSNARTGDSSSTSGSNSGGNSFNVEGDQVSNLSLGSTVLSGVAIQGCGMESESSGANGGVGFIGFQIGGGYAESETKYNELACGSQTAIATAAAERVIATSARMNTAQEGMRVVTQTACVEGSGVLTADCRALGAAFGQALGFDVNTQGGDLQTVYNQQVDVAAAGATYQNTEIAVSQAQQQRQSSSSYSAGEDNRETTVAPATRRPATTGARRPAAPQANISSARTGGN